MEKISKLLVVMMFSMTLLVSPSVLSSFADHPNEETPSDQIPLSKLNTRDVTIGTETQFGFYKCKEIYRCYYEILCK